MSHYIVATRQDWIAKIPEIPERGIMNFKRDGLSKADALAAMTAMGYDMNEYHIREHGSVMLIDRFRRVEGKIQRHRLW
jgi:hypothetical protein